MALLGGQMLIIIVAISIFYKFAIKNIFSKLVLYKDLFHYFLPSTSELKKEAGILIPSKKGKLKKIDKEINEKTEFNIPKNLDFSMYSTKITFNNFQNLFYFFEYQWLINLLVLILFVYFMTEFYFYFNQNTSEINMSFLWCFLYIVYLTKLFFSLSGLYFRGGDQAIGERNMCIVICGFYFLFSMMILIINENYLEFGLKEGYKSFHLNAIKFLESQGISYASSAPLSELMFKFWLALWSGLIALFFTFPGLRLAQMHRDAISYNAKKPFIKFCLHLSFILPIFILLLWFKPISRNLLSQKKWFDSYKTLFSNEGFETLRIFIIIFFIILRILLTPIYLQSYLNLPLVKVAKIKKQAGKIKNTDLKIIISSVYQYLCVVTLQYLTPLFKCLIFVILFKSLSGHSWLANTSYLNSQSSINNHKNQEFLPNLTLKNLSPIFSTTFFQGLLGYMLWWIIFVISSTNLMGLTYYSHFTETTT